MLTRRDMLKGMMLTGGFCILPFGRRGWVLAAPAPADRHMIVVLMRGAVDGLSIVAPYREQNYYRARTTIALPPPGQEGGLIDLNGFFGLNPVLSSLMPMWKNHSLAFIHASGSPATTRSHFEAQDIMETAMMRSAMATQGWMNGLAQALPNNQSPTRDLSFSNVLPKIFQGPVNISSVSTGGRRVKGYGKKGMDHQTVAQQEFAQMYGDNTALGDLYKQGMAAQESVMKDTQDMSDMNKEMVAASRGAPGTDAFVQASQKAAAMIRNDPSVQLLFMDVGGWDTHVQQGGNKGQLANKLERFGNGLAALAQGLGPAYKNTAILVMSEFGRTVHENGNGGSDHGHGNVAWLMGGGVKGGVYCRWPGLDDNHLYEGRDLAVTTDFRSIVGAVAGQHFGLSNDKIAGFIPEYTHDPGLDGLIT